MIQGRRLAVLLAALLAPGVALAAETLAVLNPRMAIVYPRSAQGVELMSGIAEVMASSQAMHGGLGEVYLHQSTVTLATARLRAGEVKVHFLIREIEHRTDLTALTDTELGVIARDIASLRGVLGAIQTSDLALPDDAPLELRTARDNRTRYQREIGADIGILRQRIGILQRRVARLRAGAQSARQSAAAMKVDKVEKEEFGASSASGGVSAMDLESGLGPSAVKPSGSASSALATAPSLLATLRPPPPLQAPAPPRASRLDQIVAHLAAAIREARGGEQAPPVDDRLGARALIRWIGDQERAQALSRARFLRPSELSAVGLRDLGLGPRYAVSLDGAQYRLSPPFALADGRLVVAALVTAGDRTSARMFYRSGSQGVWALCESGTLNRENQIGYFSKGYAEEDVHLPLELTALLHRISTTTAAAVLAPGRPERVVRGLVEVDSASIVATASGRRISLDYANAVNGDPIRFSVVGGLLRALELSVADPERVKLPDEANLPDFARPLDGYTYDSPDYAAINGGQGRLYGTVYASRNGRIHYLFVTDSNNRAAMVGAEEAGRVVNGFGVRTRFLDQSGMDAPLMEYFYQIPFADIPAAGDGAAHAYYRSNWNYVRTLPIIKYYYDKRHEQMPDALPPPSAAELVGLLLGHVFTWPRYADWNDSQRFGLIYDFLRLLPSDRAPVARAELRRQWDLRQPPAPNSAATQMETSERKEGGGKRAADGGDDREKRQRQQ